jgi:hypothetical protein
MGENMAAEFCLQDISFMLVRFFYMPYIYYMGPMALLPLRRKLCYGFLSPLKIHHPLPGLNPRTLGPVPSTLPLDHRGRPCFFLWGLMNEMTYRTKVHETGTPALIMDTAAYI